MTRGAAGKTTIGEQLTKRKATSSPECLNGSSTHQEAAVKTTLDVRFNRDSVIVNGYAYLRQVVQ